MFPTSRKVAQQTAQRLIAGHFTLTAWWTLRHAGVLDAMVKLELQGEGLNPLVHATRTSMSPEVLAGLFDYLAHAGLVSLKNDVATLTNEGKSLLENEDGVLELMRAYQPVLDMSEHLLAKLKTYGPPNGGTASSGGGMVYRKSEYLLESQSRRYGAEVYPAVQELVAKHGFKHLLDVSCGTGELLIHLSHHLKNIVGVGIGADSMAVRRANAAISAADVEKRFLAVSANPLEVCTDTQRTFERIGVSRQLWNEIDCLIATTLFSEVASSNGADALGAVSKALTTTRKNFPKAHLLLIEAVDTPRFHKNYYAPELALLLRLSKSTPWPPAKWHEAFLAAKYAIVTETFLTMDGLALFLCRPA